MFFWIFFFTRGRRCVKKPRGVGRNFMCREDQTTCDLRTNLTTTNRISFKHRLERFHHGHLYVSQLWHIPSSPRSNRIEWFGGEERIEAQEDLFRSRRFHSIISLRFHVTRDSVCFRTVKWESERIQTRATVLTTDGLFSNSVWSEENLIDFCTDWGNFVQSFHYGFAQSW